MKLHDPRGNFGMCVYCMDACGHVCDGDIGPCVGTVDSWHSESQS